MRSTFMGLEASRKGLFVQQSALYTTGHNISNANTEGYSRQRVNMQATPGYPYPGLNSPTYPGHLGTGVEASSVQRIRDEFIDRQYRQETNKLGYWESTLKSVNEMEDILAEPSEFGINQSFSDFWESLETVSTNPEDSSARKVAIAKAEALADAFSYNYKQLETIQGNLGNEIDVSTKSINTILKQIAAINGQVQELEPSGYVTNDLYDARDVLIDKLNEYLPVSIQSVPSGGHASSVAEGSLTVYYKNADGQNIILVHGREHANMSVKDASGQITSAEPHDPFTQIEFGWNDTTPPNQAIFQNINIQNAVVPPNATPITYDKMEPAKGKLLALIDAYGHTPADRDGSFGIYPDMLEELNTLANAFKDAFNAMHKVGHPLNTPQATIASLDFFTGTGAKDFGVNQQIIDNPNYIAASTGPNEEGNGKWAIELANLQFAKISPTTTIGANLLLNNDGTVNTAGVTLPSDLNNFTFQDYYIGMTGDLAVKGEEAKRLQYNSETQMITISNSRASMSSVSLDEEMTNMITFQQAYNANARMITVVDETLDKIINGMGRVGL